MNTSSVTSHARAVIKRAAQSEVDNASKTVEKRIQKFGDALATTLAAGVSAAVGTATSTAQVGVKAIGKIIDAWV